MIIVVVLQNIILQRYIFKPKSNFHTLTRKKGNNTDKSEVHAKPGVR